MSKARKVDVSSGFSVNPEPAAAQRTARVVAYSLEEDDEAYNPIAADDVDAELVTFGGEAFGSGPSRNITQAGRNLPLADALREANREGHALTRQERDQVDYNNAIAAQRDRFADPRRGHYEPPVMIPVAVAEPADVAYARKLAEEDARAADARRRNAAAAPAPGYNCASYDCADYSVSEYKTSEYKSIYD
ncbi:hypothetical protein M885DRAFT_510616 [Pelagophyceae sp. CCMP2097]|nr:hypothetical protein M885DRAFT_510616 [Pelagophyceae sp. CCMP2097]